MSIGNVWYDYDAEPPSPARMNYKTVWTTTTTGTVSGTTSPSGSWYVDTADTGGVLWNDFKHVNYTLASGDHTYTTGASYGFTVRLNGSNHELWYDPVKQKLKPPTKKEIKKREAEARKRERRYKLEQKKLKLADEKSMKLLKKWMTTNEWKALMEKGELEIPSKIKDNEIYIVKKAAYEKVIKKVDGKPVSKHCLVTKKHYPDGDVLLNKILLLKTNEQKFLDVAIETKYDERYHDGFNYTHVAYAYPEPREIEPEQRRINFDINIEPPNVIPTPMAVTPQIHINGELEPREITLPALTEPTIGELNPAPPVPVMNRGPIRTPQLRDRS